MNWLSSLFSPQAVATVAFLMVVALTIVGALIAVAARNIFHNVLGLAASLLGVSGLFCILTAPSWPDGNPDLRGAICIAICFAIMLSEPLHLPRPPRNMTKLLGAGLGAGAVFVFLALLVKKTKWVPAPERSNDWSVTTIGHYLLTNYALIFELVSLLLLVAMLGAIVTARGGRGKP
jgi:NADH-quinone oxidoreductase subunit J